MPLPPALIVTLGVLTALAAPAHAEEPVPTNGAIPCTCRYKGTDIPVGQTVCVVISEQARLMVCDRVLNNTAWKVIGEDCPQAFLQTEKPPVGRL